MTLADKVKTVFDIRLRHRNMTHGMALQEEVDRIQATIDSRTGGNNRTYHFQEYREKMKRWQQVQIAHLIHVLGNTKKDEVILALDTSDQDELPVEVKVYFFHRSILESFFNTETTWVSDILRYVRQTTVNEVYDIEDEYGAVVRAAILYSYRQAEEYKLSKTAEKNPVLQQNIKDWFTVDEMMNALLLIQYSEPMRYQARIASLSGLTTYETDFVMQAYTNGRSVLRFLIDEVREIVYSYTYQATEEGYADIPPMDEEFFNLVDMMVGLDVVKDSIELYQLGGVSEDEYEITNGESEGAGNT